MEDRRVVDAYRRLAARLKAAPTSSAHATRQAGLGRLHRLTHVVCGDAADRLVAAPGRRARCEHEIAPGRQTVRAVFAAIVGERRGSAPRGAERTFARDRVVADAQHADADARHRPVARIADDTGDDSTAHDRQYQAGGCLCVCNDDRRTGALRTRGAVARAQIRVLESLELETSRRQSPKRETPTV